MGKPKTARTDHDNPWKQIFTDFFEEGIQFITPSLWLMIDWSRGYEFLEQELYEIKKTRFRGAKLCDKLAKVWLLNGEELFLLVHVEIESNPKVGFALRFFWYRILILDKHKTERIYSLAIYTGNPSPNQVKEYKFQLIDNEISFKFPAIKVWELSERALAKSDSVFALMLLAQKYANETTGDMQKRLKFREKLFDLALKKNFSKRRIWQALIFVKYLTTLPQDLEIKYSEYASKRFNKKSNAMFYKLEDFKLMDQMVAKSIGYSLLEKIESTELQLQQEREKNQQEREKNQQEKEKAEREKEKVALDAKQSKQSEVKLHQTVRKCFNERKWGVAEIAELFGLEKAQVEEILKKKK